MAKKKKTVNRRTVQFNTGVSPEIVEATRQFAESRGETLRAVIELALRRHMANPPPVFEYPPLPPVAVVESRKTK